MSTEQNRALARQLVEGVINQGDTSLIDELMHPDFVEHEELPPGVPPGREAPKVLFAMMRSAFPDINATIEHLIAEDDKVVLHMTWTGTQTGEFMGMPPSGNRMSISVIDILGIAEGKFVAHWGLMDNMAMMQQLGAMPAPGEGGD
jgi:steroid delta-isomerase-like uncharacterized protein